MKYSGTFLIAFTLSLLIAPAIALSAEDAQKHNYKPTRGYVPDEETAIRIAVAVWTPVYGKEKIMNEKPFTATLQNGIWHVRGSLPKGWKGGVAEADIAKDDGRIIQIYHGK